MDNATIKQKLCEISDTMKDFTLETAKIASIQSELCVVKEENKGLVKKVEQLEREVVQLKSQTCELKEQFNKQMTDTKSEKGILKNLNKAIIERLSKVEKNQNKLLSSQSSVFADESAESVSGAEILDCCPSQDSIAAEVGVSDEAGPSFDSDGGTGAKGSATIQKKPKAQRKREQEQLYKNFSKTMAGKKVQEKLWASGYLKLSVDQWEGDAGYMKPDELGDFIEKNINKLVSFTSSAESKERLILTLLKICGDRTVPKEKLKQVLDCFVQRGTITEDVVVKFLSMYK